MEDLAHTHIHTYKRTNTHTQHTHRVWICDAYRYGNVSIVYSDRVSCRDTVLQKYRNMEMVEKAE